MTTFKLAVLLATFMVAGTSRAADAQWAPAPIAVPLLGTQGPAAPYGSSIVALPPGGPAASGVFGITLYQVTHPCAKDLAVLLVHDVEKYLLMSRAGGCIPLQGTTLTLFNDFLTSPLPDAPPSTTPYGRFVRVQASNYGPDPVFPAPAPAGPYTRGFPLTAVSLNGTWTLYVMDLSDGNRGVIAGGWAFQYSRKLVATAQETAVRVPASGTGPGAAASYPITFNLTGARPEVTVTRVVLGLTVRHSFPDDLRIALQSPSGTTVILMANAGGTSPINFDLVFDDTGPPIQDQGPWNTTFVRPGSVYDTNIALPAPAPTGGYHLAFADLIGEPVAGTWKLWVYDDAPGDSGEITSATLVVDTDKFASTADILALPTSTQPFTPVACFTPGDDNEAFSVTWRVLQNGVVFDAGAFRLDGPGIYSATVPVKKGTNIVECLVDTAGAITTLAQSQQAVMVDEFTYSFAEGATGGFFDTDVVLANPTSADAPISVDFLPEGGLPFSITRTVNAVQPLTLSLDPIVPDAAVSTVVHSTNAVPLAAERTMIWDSTGYGGHGGSSAAPARYWLFAEGSQGYFSTFILLANDNTTDASVTLNFLMEGGGVVTQTRTVPPKRRLTIYAGDIPALVNQSFGIEITSTQPIIAERSMYLPGPRLFEGGHESAGVNGTSTNWFLAEGATGSFFDCFVLLSNPDTTTPAHVTLTYLLPSGETVPQTIVVAPHSRQTINVATVDRRLASADVSTTIVSDIGIVAERAMYWPSGGGGWHEGHNSFGITETGLHWGLADGRIGGPRAHQTFVLIANPNGFPAEVQVRFFKPGVTVTRSYTLTPHSRQNVWANELAELGDGAFGVEVQVLNYQPIAVEKALYWNSGGEVFAGGTNVTATRLPPP